MKSDARLRGLYAITPETADTRSLLAKVEAAIAGGATLVQYRAKDLAPALRAEQATCLVALCRHHRIPMIVNDDVALAEAVGADGVHLGRDDGDARAARLRLPHAILGVSCYADPARAEAAAALGADYVGIGSMFASSTKPDAVRATLECLGEARRRGGLPVAAIGGITAGNAGQAMAAGADMIAVVSALFDAPDIAAAARLLSNPFATHESSDARAQPAAI